MAMDTIMTTPKKRNVYGQSRVSPNYAVAGRDALKRKNIDLPSDAWKKLSIMAAAQGKSLKAFVESLLRAKADALTMEVITANPSPSGDWYFEDAGNVREV